MSAFFSPEKVAPVSRTCIICGVAANSREHVFPAALGGRRTNKGIYCEEHNEAYSGLAGVIAEQLRFFNSQLGVVGDHQRSTGMVKPVVMLDATTKSEVRLNDKSISYVSPRILSPKADGEGGSTFVLAVNSPEEAEAFVAEMREKGMDISIESVGYAGTYYPGTLQGKLDLGGKDTGLRAIAYIAQTFLAHSFPDLARLPQLAALKEYTLNGSHSDFAWWHHAKDDGLDAVGKPFAHRVIVGHNAEDDVIYARISLFEALHYVVRLGVAPTATSRSMVFDIDPLAKHEPHDVIRTEYKDAVGYVPMPQDLTAHLSASISSGHAQAAVSSLMQRIQDHQRTTTAAKWLRDLERMNPAGPEAAGAFFERLVTEESARVLMLMETFQREFIDFASGTKDLELATISANMSAHSARDASSFDGLSEHGRMLLKISTAAIKQQLVGDFLNKLLDQDRMAMLLGGGPGQYAVGMAVLERMRLPR
jgi:uncharacterized glyoxalase superfamily protein PhnB